MESLSYKQIILLVIALIIVGLLVFFVVKTQDDPQEQPPAVVEEESETDDPKVDIIGQSVEGRDIESYTFGDGSKNILFVGGIHGGYEWNSVLLAYKFIDYLENNKSSIPENLSVTIVPSANPDGLYEVIGKEGRFSPLDVPRDESHASGRFNANGVDLNRNFDCKWKSESTWRGETVGAGTEPFSEPEAQAIRKIVSDKNPEAVIFWHSQANTVYASECEEGVLNETVDIMNIYAEAGNYRSVESFDAYEITGDAEGWLASIGIPAITVELETHETIEWDRNLAGIQALFEYYK